MVLPGSKFPVVWDMAWVQVASCTPARTFRKLLYSLYYGLQREPWISVLPVQVLTRSGVEDLVPTNLSEKGLPLLFNVRRVLVRHICPFCILAFFANEVTVVAPPFLCHPKVLVIQNKRRWISVGFIATHILVYNPHSKEMMDKQCFWITSIKDPTSALRLQIWVKNCTENFDVVNRLTILALTLLIWQISCFFSFVDWKR